MFENGLVNHQNWSLSGERYFRDETEGKKKAALFAKGDRLDNILFLLEDRCFIRVDIREHGHVRLRRLFY